MPNNSIIGALRVTLGLDSAEFSSGAKKAEGGMATLEKNLTNMGARLAKIGAALTVGLTAPLVAFGVSAVNAASDAAELQSAFDQTFGDLSGSMNQWAEQTGNAMGRSTQAIQEAANTFGIFFNQAAPTRAAAAEMSKSFAVLAQDLASFYNTTEGEALEKLRSGLSGESEPLRDFGVFLTEAAVKAKAMQMGLKPVNGELTEQQKILARYNLILEKTKNAQGDVARTSGGTANQMRSAGAAFDELKVKIGNVLLPAVTPLIEALTAMLTKFGELPEGMQTGIVGFAAAAAAIGPLTTIFGGLTSAIGGAIPVLLKLGPAIGIVGKAILSLAMNPWFIGLAAVVGGIYLAWKNWDKITEFVSGVYTAVKTWLVDKLTAAWSLIKAGAIAYFELYTFLPRKAIEAVSALYTGVKTWLQDKLGVVFDWVKGKLEAVGGWFFDLYDKVIGHSYIPDMVDGIAREMARLDAVMVDPAKKATKSTGEAMRKLAGDVQALMERLFPEASGLKKFREDLATIDQGRKAGYFNDTTANESRRRLVAEGMDIRPGESTILMPLINQGDSLTKLEEFLSKQMVMTLDGLKEKARITTVSVAENFKSMADGVLQSLNSLVGAIKGGGGFFDILTSVLDLFLQVGSTGVVR